MSEEMERQSATFHKDLSDLLIEASKSIQIRKMDGKEVPVEVNDGESIYWSTRSVNSATFSRFIKKLKYLESLGKHAQYNMMPQRSKAVKESIKEEILGYKYAIDGKSSESLRDKYNTQSTLVDKMANHRVEKAYTAKQKISKGFLRSIMMKDEDD